LGGLTHGNSKSFSPQLEREAIIHALEACSGNQTRAAQVLHVSRRTLINRIEALGLPRPRKGG
jgi:DNA-binding NtrC family response regulator